MRKGLIRALPFAMIIVMIILLPAVVLAGDGDPPNLVHQMTRLVLQIGIIIFIARLGGIIFEKIRFPSVIGEISVGIIIGPYLLGGIPFPGFSDGLFPMAGTGFPISAELYGIAVIASILLLFVAGLETDLSMFLRCSVAGTAVGFGGVVVSFIAGAYTGAYFLDAPFIDPRCLFLGAMGTATSVGITARILSERKKMDSPEGVTIVAGAVIDDILGIIILAIVLAIAAMMKTGGGSGVDWTHVEFIAIKAVVVWLGFTALGLLFANKIGSFLKMFKNIRVFSIIAFGMALILAGIFEKAGLAMIIGAYVMGLSFSKTDLSHVIQETLHPVYVFMVPVFFVVMGMLVNVNILASKTVLVMGIVYTIGAILAKIVGCMIPPLFLKFNARGALRIGLGMVPRGEVALIIAGIGLASGFLDNEIFGISVLMTLVTTVVAPPLLNASLRNPASGTRREFRSSDLVTLTFDFENGDTSDMVASKVLNSFDREGFYIHMREIDCRVYSIRKDKVSITLFRQPQRMVFETSKDDVRLVRTVIYEGILDLYNIISKLEENAKAEDMRREVAKCGGRTDFRIDKILNPRCIIMNLNATTKEEIIEKLVDVLDRNGEVRDKMLALQDVLERESSMSTGMESGVAIPHGKTDGVEKMTVAVGFKRDGADFGSIDGEPSRIFVMVLSPKRVTGPHIQFLACMSALLIGEECREKLLGFTTPEEVWNFLKEKM